MNGGLSRHTEEGFAALGSSEHGMLRKVVHGVLKSTSKARPEQI